MNGISREKFENKTLNVSFASLWILWWDDNGGAIEPSMNLSTCVKIVYKILFAVSYSMSFNYFFSI